MKISSLIFLVLAGFGVVFLYHLYKQHGMGSSLFGGAAT